LITVKKLSKIASSIFYRMRRYDTYSELPKWTHLWIRVTLIFFFSFFSYKKHAYLAVWVQKSSFQFLVKLFQEQPTEKKQNPKCKCQVPRKEGSSHEILKQNYNNSTNKTTSPLPPLLVKSWKLPPAAQ
jgi:hypothetical protein